MEQIKRLKGHTGDVYAIEVAQEDSILRFGNMISGGDYTIKTWNTEVGDAIRLTIAIRQALAIKPCKVTLDTSVALKCAVSVSFLDLGTRRFVPGI
jgi:hypothetical protein